MYDAQIKNLVMNVRRSDQEPRDACTMNSITFKKTHTVHDIAMDTLVMDESSSLLWFSFRAKVATNS